jgi:hypothetical protein
MTVQDLGSIGELIAALATIATLVYLSVQIRQNTRTVKSSIIEAAGTRHMDIAKYVGSDGDLSRIVMTAMLGGSELDDTDSFRLSMVFWAAMRSYEVTIAHHEEGLLDESQYVGLEKNLSVWVGSSHFQVWWRGAHRNFSRSLNELVARSTESPQAFPSSRIENET